MSIYPLLFKTTVLIAYLAKPLQFRLQKAAESEGLIEEHGANAKMLSNIAMLDKYNYDYLLPPSIKFDLGLRWVELKADLFLDFNQNNK